MMLLQGLENLRINRIFYNVNEFDIDKNILYIRVLIEYFIM